MRQSKNNQIRAGENSGDRLPGGRLKILHGNFWRLPTIKQIMPPALPAFRFN
jgi:hypothetical protein